MTIVDTFTMTKLIIGLRNLGSRRHFLAMLLFEMQYPQGNNISRKQENPVGDFA